MSWHEKYMKNMVTIESLNKLVDKKLLTQEEVDKMVQDRKDKFGY